MLRCHNPCRAKFCVSKPNQLIPLRRTGTPVWASTILLPAVLRKPLLPLSPPELVTVRVKLVPAVRAPSLTVRVMVAEPDWPAAGVTVTVRLAPEPPKTMLAAGTKVVLEEAPLTVSEAAAVWAEPTVKASAPVLAPMAMV